MNLHVEKNCIQKEDCIEYSMIGYSLEPRLFFQKIYEKKWIKNDDYRNIIKLKLHNKSYI